ncbi:hypothetical protein AB1N83_004014 [Pleurotus pulmonarius]
MYKHALRLYSVDPTDKALSILDGLSNYDGTLCCKAAGPQHIQIVFSTSGAPPAPSRMSSSSQDQVIRNSYASLETICEPCGREQGAFIASMATVHSLGSLGRRTLTLRYRMTYSRSGLVLMGYYLHSLFLRSTVRKSHVLTQDNCKVHAEWSTLPEHIQLPLPIVRTLCTVHCLSL